MNRGRSDIFLVAGIISLGDDQMLKWALVESSLAVVSKLSIEREGTNNRQ